MSLDFLWAALVGFALGSIPSGYLVARARGVDIRASGSGNIGATNVLRVLGKGPGYLVFACDIGKGVLAVLLAQGVFPVTGEWGMVTAGVACVLGHNFTPWLRFRGGKGIATSAGVMLGLLPWASLLAIAFWGVVFLATRYVSVASLAASAALPVITWALGGIRPRFWFALAAGLLGILRHRENIRRLLAGTESRFQRKSSRAEGDANS